MLREDSNEEWKQLRCLFQGLGVKLTKGTRPRKTAFFILIVYSNATSSSTAVKFYTIIILQCLDVYQMILIMFLSSLLPKNPEKPPANSGNCRSSNPRRSPEPPLMAMALYPKTNGMIILTLYLVSFFQIVFFRLWLIIPTSMLSFDLITTLSGRSLRLENFYGIFFWAQLLLMDTFRPTCKQRCWPTGCICRIGWPIQK